METSEPDAVSQGAGAPKRKAYHSPSLTTFGSVGSLTQLISTTMNVDGGGFGMSKTG